MIVNDDDLKKALDRIARTADGELLYRYLQRELIAIPAVADPSDGALRENLGHRRFAAKLMGLMAEGIDSVGQADDTSGDGQRRTERPVVFVAAKPARIGGSGESAREWIARTDPELAAQRKPGAD